MSVLLAGFALLIIPAAARERLLYNVTVPLAEKPASPAASVDALCKGPVVRWKVPATLKDRDGAEVTVLLRPREDGAIAGMPRRTYTAGVSTSQDRTDLFNATIDGIRRCPARMSRELAGRIAGHTTFLHVTYKTAKHRGL